MTGVVVTVGVRKLKFGGMCFLCWVGVIVVLC